MDSFTKLGEAIGAIRDELALIRSVLERMDARIEAVAAQREQTALTPPPAYAAQSFAQSAREGEREPMRRSAGPASRFVDDDEASPAPKDVLFAGRDIEDETASAVPVGRSSAFSDLPEDLEPAPRRSRFEDDPEPLPTAHSSDQPPSDDDLVNLLQSIGRPSPAIPGAPAAPTDSEDKVDFSTDDLESILGLTKK